MLKALIAAVILLPSAAIASDCVTNTSGNRVCIHRVRVSNVNPAINMAEFSINGGSTFMRLVDCATYRVYSPHDRTWLNINPGAVVERVCTEWE